MPIVPDLRSQMLVSAVLAVPLLALSCGQRGQDRTSTSNKLPDPSYVNAQAQRKIPLKAQNSNITGAFEQDTQSSKPVLQVNSPETATVFSLCELQVTIPAEFENVPDTQIHDAYDADRDGVFLNLKAVFSLDGKHSLTVPGFAMRERPGGRWRWQIRWAPDRPGNWRVRLHFEGRATPTSKIVRIQQELPRKITVTDKDGIKGRLVAPKPGQNPHYVRRLRSDGASDAVWLFGACRAWVVRSQDKLNDWYPHEWLDRETELFAPMREAGFNLLNQWMAPWEFLIVHHDRAEHWQNADGRWRRVPLPQEAAWSSYQSFDQGRAKAFDKLVRLCEGDVTKPTIHLLLSPLSHQCLQVKEHPWGGQESGWSPENDAGKQTRERLNGFSGFKRKMSVWEFFEADPSRALDDWRAQLWDHQANFWRYMIARWGYSRAIGMWVIVDELDAVGDKVGVMSQKKGWWAHPQCDRWLANTIRLFRGELKRSDGLRYDGDPFQHPLHAATTSFGGEGERGGNLDWPGGPTGARPDLFGWHWYPYWPEGTDWSTIWAYMIDGVAAYAQSPIGQAPRLISEFGVADRNFPEDKPSYLYPTLYHHAIWTAIFSGQAGTPMDWDDGKQFGELRWREREGIFDRQHYPIDHTAELKALRRFLGKLNPDELASCSAADAKVKLKAAGRLRAFALFRRGDVHGVYGWIFSPDGSGKFSIKGLKKSAYRLTWYDPWTGDPIPGLGPQSLDARPGKALEINAAPVLKVLRALSRAKPFPHRSRQAQGHDAAFKLLWIP